MGLFSNKNKFSNETFECKLCQREFNSDNYNAEFGLCNACMLIANSEIQSFSEVISLYQEKANATNVPNEKIMYLRLMLDYLYEYKVKYVDNDIHLIDQDIDELIDDVIECISEAKR